MKKLLNISCKRATFLISKKEADKTGFLDNIKLRIHLIICNACRLFEKQNWFIKLNAHYNHEHLDITLSNEAKQKIELALKSEF